MQSELTTFSSYGQPDRSPRNWFAALFGSLIVYGIAILVFVGVASRTHQVVVEKRVDLTFVEKIVRPEPPPAPVVEPLQLEPAKPAAAAAPLVRPDQKTRRLDKPPAPKELVAPKEMPREIPKEAEPTEDKGVAVYGEPDKGDAAGLEGGMQGGVVGGKVGVIELPAEATAPRPLASNVPPRYPESARRRGKMGKVMLKVVIQADGSVGEILVVEGEEPFVRAAEDSVRRWRFEPARYHGQAISVYRLIPITFNLED